jgi:predicted nuclease with TOPRIM domain
MTAALMFIGLCIAIYEYYERKNPNSKTNKAIHVHLAEYDAVAKKNMELEHNKKQWNTRLGEIEKEKERLKNNR